MGASAVLLLYHAACARSRPTACVSQQRRGLKNDRRTPARPIGYLLESTNSFQSALRILLRRQLIRARHDTRTAVPEYTVNRPWAR
jgi:hypothetical protein